MTGFDFKFFVQSTVWRAGELQKEIDKGTWFCASVSKDVLFKSRDRMGTQRAKVRENKSLARFRISFYTAALYTSVTNALCSTLS
jgi:putative AlgH/UPF0301 family transcriptional regulator